MQNYEQLGMNKKSDELLLPKHYKVVDMPYYKGNGSHSIKELEELCNQYQEYCHQQAVIKQRLIDELQSTEQKEKFDKDYVNGLRMAICVTCIIIIFFSCLSH